MKKEIKRTNEKKSEASDQKTKASPDRLEGKNAIMEAVRAGRPIHKLWVAKRDGKIDPGLQQLVAAARQSGATILPVDRQVLDRISETRAHQGVIAQVAAHAYADLDTLVQSVKAGGQNLFLFVLDEIQDSYNLGSILRVADAAGVQGVVISKRRSVGLDAAVAKASTGAIEYVPVCRVSNISQAIDQLKKEGAWIVGTDAEACLPYDQADLTGDLVILIGGEDKGLSPHLLKQCDFLVKIPMRGHVPSLNAAVAAGVIAFEAARQRQAQAVNKEVRAFERDQTE